MSRRPYIENMRHWDRSRPRSQVGQTGPEAGGQSRAMSLLEATTNVVVGFAVAVLLQLILLPLFGIDLPMNINLLIATAFTAASIIRSYVLRRIFEAYRTRT